MSRPVRRALLACVAAAGAVALAVPQAGARPVGKPAFTTYHEPGEDEGSGEPSIGVNWKTGTVVYQSNLRTLNVTFDSHGRARWEERSGILESRDSLDPILFTDSATGRTFVSQLAADCSLMSYSDDDGKSWTPTTGCGPGVYVDHQTVGAGPYAKGVLPVAHPLYPNAVYYCAQAVAEASCARSDDGGLTFGAAVPMYDITQCGGLHGHIRVAPDGAAYVAHQDCDGGQGVVVTEDNGLTWNVRTVPGSTVNGESDPSVAAGSGGTVYFGYQDGAGNANTKAMIATTRDHGKTWSKPVDVGSRLGLKNVQFPEVIAGDDDRAAFAFLGTKTGGNDQSDSFDGAWHLYVALTYDRGRTWTTVDATPSELVQRGCIKLTGCSHRNLLDFNDISVDKQGRVVVAWADGCPRACEKGAPWDSRWHTAAISRLSSGRGLFKAYDGKL
ncbi:MAG TPA: sialidase family protein [Mycobacteriales bacterium]|nr:sialidase family protein [Mycobacteriales bacterium]